MLKSEEPPFIYNTNLIQKRLSVSQEKRVIGRSSKVRYRPSEVYKSHEKVPAKVKAPREIRRNAKLPPVRVDQSHLSDKVKVLHNLFLKQERFYYSARVDIRSILRNIYYNSHTVESLEELKVAAFNRLKHQQDFFSVVYEEGKTFSGSVNQFIMSRLSRLSLPSSNCQPGQQNNSNRTIGDRFLPFSQNTRLFQRTIDELYNQFKYLEHVNSEIDKLTKDFILFFIQKRNFNCEGFNFHSRLFVAFIYDNRTISSFFEGLYELFKNHEFLERSHAETAQKVSQIYEISKQHIEESRLSLQQPLRREGNPTAETQLITPQPIATQPPPNPQPPVRSSDVEEPVKQVETEIRRKRKKKNKKKPVANVVEGNVGGDEKDDCMSEKDKVVIQQLAELMSQTDERITVHFAQRVKVSFDSKEVEFLKVLLESKS